MNEPRTLPTPEPDLSGVLDWGATLAEHDRWLRRVVASRLGEPQAVDEVMQDVALAAVAQRSPLHNPARVAVWLYRLAVRQVLIYRRKTGRQRSLVDRYAARNRRARDRLRPRRRWAGWSAMNASKWFRTRCAGFPLGMPSFSFSSTPRATQRASWPNGSAWPISTIEARLHRARRRLRAELAALAAEFEASDHDRP